MGKTRYHKIKEILDDIVGQEYHQNKLWQRIMVYIGSDQRTIRDCMKLMIALGMIQELENMRYKIIKCEADI